MVGDILDGTARRQEGVPLQVAPRNDHVADVNGILRQEAMPPVVHRQSELRPTGSRFEPFPVKPKTEIGAQDPDGGGVRKDGRGNGSLLPVIRGINPVVHAEAKICNARLRIVAHGKSGKEHFAPVRLPVAVGVFEIEDVRRGGRDQSALPRQEARDLLQAVGKDRGAVDAPVIVRVDQKPDAAFRLLSGGRVERVVEHLGDEGPALLVEDQFDRVDHVRFSRKEFHAEAFVNLKASERLFRRERAGAARATGR